MIPIPASQYDKLLELLNIGRSQPFDFILEAREEDNGEFVGIAQDGVQLIGFRVENDGSKEYFILNLDEIGATDTQPTAEETGFAEPSDEGTIAQYTDRLSESARPALSALMGQLQAMKDRSNSLEEFKGAIESAFSELDTDALAAIVAEALFAAKLSGIYEAQEGE